MGDSRPAAKKHKKATPGVPETLLPLFLAASGAAIYVNIQKNKPNAQKDPSISHIAMGKCSYIFSQCSI